MMPSSKKKPVNLHESKIQPRHPSLDVPVLIAPSRTMQRYRIALKKITEKNKNYWAVGAPPEIAS